MDLSQLGAGEVKVEVGDAALKETAHEVVDLLSDEELALESPVKATSRDHPHLDETDSDDSSVVGYEAVGEDDRWEIESLPESLLEQNLEEIGDEHLHNGIPNACTLEEALEFRRMLRAVGPEEFCRRTVESDNISAKKLLTAFGIRPPLFLEGCPDESYYSLLGLSISRELSKRVKLAQYNTIDDAVELIKSSKNIIVLTGAGISTSLGIPDFRSKETGFYSRLAHLGLSDPQEVFDIDIFRQDPTIFYGIAKDILPNTERFTPTHAFINLLQDKGKLLTNYSQNIDNLEAKAGILPEKLVQCHGSFATASCVKCGAKVRGEEIYPELREGVVPRCKQCITAIQEALGMKRKRSKKTGKRRVRRFNGSPDSSSDSDDDIPDAGVMKPDITFFGEALPDTFSERLTNHDKNLVDLVIVIGTSLKVAPVSEVVPYLPAHIPQMYISRTPVSHVNFDIDMLGDCDVVVAELCRRAGWNLKHEMIPDKQIVKVELQNGFPSRHVFTEVKE